MRFLRHDGIYRSDVSLLLVNPAQMPPPVGRPRCRAIARDGRSTPCPSSAMSSGRLFLDRGGRHQSPSPLRRHPQNKSLAFRRANKYHRTAGSVLTVCVSRGGKRTAMIRHIVRIHPWVRVMFMAGTTEEPKLPGEYSKNNFILLHKPFTIDGLIGSVEKSLATCT